MSNALLTRENLVSAPIAEGDAGIILKTDGSFRVFSCAKLDPENLTPAQREQGEKLVALAVALSQPTIMDLLLTMSKDPAIVGDGIDLGARH